jgi:hypothetical protein
VGFEERCIIFSLPSCSSASTQAPFSTTKRYNFDCRLAHRLSALPLESYILNEPPCKVATQERSSPESLPKCRLYEIKPISSNRNQPFMAQAVTSLPSAVTDAVSYWLVYPTNGQCQSSTDASLWFASLLAFAVAWSYVLGANDVRRWIHDKLGALSKPWSVKVRIGVSILGSLTLQFAMTVLTASILQNSPDSPSPYQGLSYPFVAWYLRPLPATAICISGLISPRSYMHNSIYVSIVELLYSLGSIGFYIELRKWSSAALSVLSDDPYAGMGQPTNTSTTGSTPASTRASITSKISAHTSQTTSVTVSKDRTCGGQNGYNCKGSTWGNCCSNYGYCGSDTNYCGTGCQSAFGDCSTAKIIRRAISSPDGTCGESSGYTCFNSTHGHCCSSYYFCGDTTEYCASGCQPGFGECDISALNTSSLTTQGMTSSLSLMSTGSLVGIFYSAPFFLALFALVYAFSRWRRASLKIVAALCVLLNAWRLVVSFILWNAALQFAPGVFCPDSDAVAKITALWFFVPAIDHFWRALF